MLAVDMETIPGVRVRGSLVRRLYHADWFVTMDLLIFHILMNPKVIPNVIVQLYVLPEIIFRLKVPTSKLNMYGQRAFFSCCP